MTKFTCSGLEKAWYLYYYFKNPSTDYISHQLMDFKADKTLQLKTFSIIAAEECGKLKMHFDYVTRVLSSAEMKPTSNSRVRTLAIAIATEIGAAYIPNLLKKTKSTNSLKGLNKSQRKAELSGVYEVSDDYDIDNKNVLLVDDISTTGTSFQTVAGMIKSKYKEAIIFGFCLGKSMSFDFDGVSANPKEWVEQYKNKLNEVQSK